MAAIDSEFGCPFYIFEVFGSKRWGSDKCYSCFFKPTLSASCRAHCTNDRRSLNEDIPSKITDNWFGLWLMFFLDFHDGWPSPVDPLIRLLSFCTCEWFKNRILPDSTTSPETWALFLWKLVKWHPINAFFDFGQIQRYSCATNVSNYNTPQRSAPHYH